MGYQFSRTNPAWETDMTNREILDDLAAAQEALRTAQEAVSKAHAAVNHRGSLPDPEVAEDAIVAALVVHPEMAGRVMAKFAYETTAVSKNDAGLAAAAWCDAESIQLRSSALKSLAFALAAASYRGA